MTNQKPQQIRAIRRLRTFGALTVFAAALAAYGYFLSHSIVDVVVREEVKKDIAHLQSEISTLESAYIEARYALSEQAMTHTAYVPAREKHFLTRTTRALALTEYSY